MIYFVAVGLLILLVTFSTSIVSLSICHYRYCLLKKVIPTLEADADYNLKSHPENMRDFRILLALLENGVIQATNFFTKFYSFLKCEDLQTTIRLHLLLFTALFMLILFPLRFFLLFLLDILALLHPIKQFFNEAAPSSHPTPTKDFSESETPYSNFPDKSEQNTSELITEASDLQGDGSLATDSECSEKLADDTDEEAPQDALLNTFLLQPPPSISNNSQPSQPPPPVEQQPDRRESPLPCSSTTNNSINNHSTMILSRNVLNQRVPNLVEKLMELKKRAKNLEKCSGCGAVFTAILKRRHICSSCGNHYCARCCSHKVPRSKFGATAPAAQTETVAVCTRCLHKLVDLEKEKIV